MCVLLLSKATQGCCRGAGPPTRNRDEYTNPSPTHKPGMTISLGCSSANASLISSSVAGATAAGWAEKEGSSPRLESSLKLMSCVCKVRLASIQTEMRHAQTCDDMDL